MTNDPVSSAPLHISRRWSLCSEHLHKEREKNIQAAQPQPPEQTAMWAGETLLTVALCPSPTLAKASTIETLGLLVCLWCQVCVFLEMPSVPLSYTASVIKTEEVIFIIPEKSTSESCREIKKKKKKKKSPTFLSWV